MPFPHSYYLRETSMILITKAEKAMQSIAIPIAFEVNMLITSCCSIIDKSAANSIYTNWKKIV